MHVRITTVCLQCNPIRIVWCDGTVLSVSGSTLVPLIKQSKLKAVQLLASQFLICNPESLDSHSIIWKCIDVLLSPCSTIRDLLKKQVFKGHEWSSPWGFYASVSAPPGNAEIRSYVPLSSTRCRLLVWLLLLLQLLPCWQHARSIR